jgi:hypothetical protein
MPTISKDAAMAELERIVADLPSMTMDAAETAMNDAMLFLLEKVPGYPEAREDQGYRRTGTLGRTITTGVDRYEGMITGQLGTNTPYAPWVIGADYPGELVGDEMKYQAQVHKGRWWQLGDIYEDNVDGAWLIFEEKFWKDLKKRIQEAN